MATVRNEFDTLQGISKTHTPNEEYENFVNAHTESAAEFIPTKPRAKHRVPWETLAVRSKQYKIRTVSLCNKRNPTNTNVQKLKKAQRELTNANKKNTFKVRSIKSETW